MESISRLHNSVKLTELFYAEPAGNESE
jgi:hypothetical protein